jgi:hypothetical protein
MTNQRIGQSRTPSLSELLNASVTQAFDGFFVALPGRVEKYISATQTADIKPLLKRAVIDQDGGEDVEELPVIPNVPILFMRTSQFFLSLPLSVGDNVLLLFCDRSIDGYMGSTGAVDLDPVDLRQHNISDAVAIPGFFPISRGIKDVIEGDMVLGKEKGIQVRCKGATNTVEVTSSGLPNALGGFVALAALVATELTKIQTALNTHVHSGVTTGVGTSGTAAPVYTPASVASTNLKAD